MNSVLSIVTFLPAVAAGIMALFLRGDDAAARRNARWLALIATLATFLVSLVALFGYDPGQPGFQFVEEYPWLAGMTYRVGVDGISLVLVMLTTFIMPLVILACWNVDMRTKDYMIAFLVLETLMVGVFVALDLILFYIFFEGSLIPMFLIIGVWGGKQRIYAAFKFFLYTFLGSVLMLVAMIAMYFEAGTTNIILLLEHDFPSSPLNVFGLHITGGMQTLLFIGFFASFAVKLPMVPVHTWLSDAHVQAPTGGSMVLAAILLKMGGYGFLRFNLPMLPVGSEIFTPYMLWISAIAVVYASLVALAQEDWKKLVAYSSVAHMGFVTMGIFAGNRQGIDGALFQMVSHGLISTALFFIVGVVYDRMHTREIDAYGGLAIRMPVYALLFMFFTFANIGLPGTSGFVGEFLSMAGTFQVNTWAATVACSGVIFSAGYALYLYRRVIFGDLIKEALKTITDMSPRERLVLLPLAVTTLWFGLYPAAITDIIGPSTEQVAANYQDARTSNMLAAAEE